MALKVQYSAPLVQFASIVLIGHAKFWGIFDVVIQNG